MESWNNIINTAMIGTDKKTVSTAELPQGLASVAGTILENAATDKEEKFLQVAALVFNYRHCGVQPLQKEQATLPPAPAEEKQYCSALALQSLKDVLAEESTVLQKLWLTVCAEKNKIVLPEAVPLLLETGIQNKNLQTIITSCCGKRGEWLSRFNENWNFSAHQTAEDQWQTGTPGQRLVVLKTLRQSEPAKARDWLQQTWPQEDAATKQNFLDIFTINIGQEDIPFLESLQTEKSKKVKEAALHLLKQIPGSSIVQQYKAVLQQTVQLKKEKTLLGLASKQVLQFQLPDAIDEAIFKTGIDKLSSNSKAFSDEEFIIYQLIQSVPPGFWQQQLNESPETLIKQFQQHETGKKMMSALAIATEKFNDDAWAIALSQHSETFYLNIIPLLPLQQQDVYSNQYFAQHPDNIIQYAVQRETEWNAELAKKIFTHSAKNYYQYNKTFYSQHIHLIPGKIAPELEKCSPQEDYLNAAWSNTSEYILKLLHLKARVTASFNE